MGSGQTEGEFIAAAANTIKETSYRRKVGKNSTMCVVDDIVMEEDFTDVFAIANSPDIDLVRLVDDTKLFPQANISLDASLSPIKEAEKWSVALPEGAKELTVLLSGGLINRPCLLIPNENGIYDTLLMYKNKKAAEPLAVLPAGQFVEDIVDESIKGDKTYTVSRNMRVLEIAPDASRMRMWISAAVRIDDDSVFSPKSLHQEIVEHVGHPFPVSNIGANDEQLLLDCMCENWMRTMRWWADAIHYMIEKKGVEVIFSHFHSVDLQSHRFIRYMYDKGENVVPVEQVWQYMEDVYKQVDYYVAQFMEYLDKDWTIFLFSDHAQICGKHRPYGMGDIVGINIPVMKELGFTVLQKDENGKEIAEIDWTKTKAIAWGEQHIYLNLIGRTDHGIVDPKDQYDLEEEIITALYGYKHPETGKRIISVALRNRDAVLLGQGGPYAGDICYWVAEGYNYDHADTLSTALGEAGTSVSPIFIAAGKGIKQGYTDRIIRQIDFAPTVAAVGGMRMPHQCEGAPVYQILEKEM